MSAAASDEIVQPSVFDASHHWSFVGVSCVFAARGAGKSTLARSLVTSSGASSVVLLGDARGYAEGSVLPVNTWDAAQQAVQESREAGGLLLVIDSFHGDEPIDRQPWLRNYLLTCRGNGNGAMIVYDSPFFLGRLTPVVRLAANDLFIGRFVASEEGRRMNALVATVNDDLNKHTKRLLDFVCRDGESGFRFLHVRTDTLAPELRFNYCETVMA